ncbi:MAG TPA: hypothetical protein VGD64_03785 [Acidisarcina sp.]
MFVPHSISRSLGLASATTLVLLACACTVNVEKNKDGGDKNVKIDTPLGGIHVTQDQVSAADTGLPQYPGARVDSDHEGDKSADIHMGFGDWEMRIKVVRYQTSDQQEKVLAFYKKALGRYGDVIECNGKHAVGTPTTTREGLTCDDSGQHADIHFDDAVDQEKGHYLKAGSKRHQHIMGIESSSSADETKFSLVQLDLPAGMDKGESN